MTEFLLILLYGITIVASTMFGGYLPQVIRLNHVRMQVVLSFVGGMMLGVAVLILLPHGFISILQHYADNSGLASTLQDTEATQSQLRDVLTSFRGLPIQSLELTMTAMLVGLLFTFFMMRAFHFHQHGEGAEEGHVEHDCDHQHDDHSPPRTKLGWVGMFFGLGLHTFMDGVALGLAVRHDLHPDFLSGHQAGWAPAGFGVYLAILLHKPLDALSLSTLMAAEKISWRVIQAANVGFGLMCIAGALSVFSPIMVGGIIPGCMLAASAGVFLCISLSDLLPEVQFHRHDRIQLSAAMLCGIGVSFLIEFFHQHH